MHERSLERARGTRKRAGHVFVQLADTGEERVRALWHRQPHARVRGAARLCKRGLNCAPALFGFCAKNRFRWTFTATTRPLTHNLVYYTRRDSMINDGLGLARGDVLCYSRRQRFVRAEDYARYQVLTCAVYVLERGSVLCDSRTQLLRVLKTMLPGAHVSSVRGARARRGGRCCIRVRAAARRRRSGRALARFE